MRRRTSVVAYWAELGVNVSVWGVGLIGVALAADRLDFAGAGALLLGAKVILDLVSILWLSPRQLSARRARWVLVADFLNFWVWLQGAVRRTVDWRGTRLLIGAQTRLEPLATTGSAEHHPEAREVYSAANS